MRRRQALAVLAALAACKPKTQARGDGPHPSDAADSAERARSGDWREVTWEPGAEAAEGERAFVLVPAEAAEKPVLVALHGRGESGNGLGIGARAWPFEYELDRLEKRLRAPPLNSGDMMDVVDAARVVRLNELLAAKPYLGMTVACPYCPYQPDHQEAFAAFVCGPLLARARTEAKVTAARERTGIDGVSMGGRQALQIGLDHPEIFGTIGALQPALKPDEGPMWSALAQKAMKKAPIKLRLVTSERDVFREAVTAVAARLAADGVPHELLILPGEHGYTFNRGPGGLEMLFWHERVTRGLPSA